MGFADFGFTVDGEDSSCCDMVHHDHNATVDMVSRGCFDLPEIAWICLGIAWMMPVAVT
jgi:hypothetical protein